MKPGRSGQDAVVRSGSGVAVAVSGYVSVYNSGLVAGPRRKTLQLAGEAESARYHTVPCLRVLGRLGRGRTIPRSATAVRRRNRGGSWGSGCAESWVPAAPAGRQDGGNPSNRGEPSRAVSVGCPWGRGHRRRARSVHGCRRLRARRWFEVRRDVRDSDPLLIAVDERDRETGVVGKMTAHRRGILHRAFSIFVFDEAGRLLLQRRAGGKYHSGGLWSNTCCSHPRAGESLIEAAHRRLREEEMGFNCPLRAVFGFVYRATLDSGLVEHEFDHVVVGRFQGGSRPPTRARWAGGSGSACRRSNHSLPTTRGRSPRGSSRRSTDFWPAVFRRGRTQDDEHRASPPGTIGRVRRVR